MATNPDAVVFKFVPITSLLNGILGSGYLSHAINLYLRCMFFRFSYFQMPLFILFLPMVCTQAYMRFLPFICWIFGGYNFHLFLKLKLTQDSLFIDKPPIEDLQYFLEFQVSRQWVPLFGELPLRHQRSKASYPLLQFSCLGPKVYVNTIQV